MNFVKKSVVNIFLTGFLGLTNLLIGVVVSRFFGPDGVGQYQLVVSSSLVVSALVTFGIGGAVIYFINQKISSPEKIASVSLKFSIMTGVIAAVLFSMILRYEAYFGTVSIMASVAMGVYCGLLVVVTTVWPILIADLQVIKYQLVSLSPRLTLLICIFILILFQHITIDRVWVVTAVTQMTAVLLTIWFLWGKLSFKIPMDFSLIRQLAQYGLKLNLSYIVLLLNSQIGLLLIRALISGNFTEVGYYRNAASIGALILMFNQAIGPMLYAKWSATADLEKQLQVERVSRVLWVGMVFGLVLLALISRPVIYLLYGQEFIPSISVLQWLLVGIGAQFLYTPLFRLFSGSGKPLYTSAVLVVNLLVMCALMVVLIPRFQADGAAMAFSGGNLVGLVLSYYWASVKFNINIHRCFLLNKADVSYILRMLKA